ncbi:MAG: hypothetical protein C5B50_14365 [Verrucomicrobia bacterium]|nr:MAG: hypothetical protein C5B50_14365 [Verrucomicrobiota bacterium]
MIPSIQARSRRKTMPRRELKYPHQVEDWLVELGQRLTEPGEMILIGSGALLWHAFQKEITTPLPENAWMWTLLQIPTRLPVYVMRPLLGLSSNKSTGGT